MVLHAEYPVVGTFQPLHGVVQKVYMGCRQGRITKTCDVYRIGMVLGSDFHVSCFEILYRVVAAAVAEFQLVGFGTVGQRDDLVPQTDTEYGVFSPQLPNQLNHTLHILRISGAVGQEYTVRRKRVNLLGSHIPWKNRHITAPAVQAADNILLHAAVNGCDAVFRVLCRGNIRLLRTDPGNLIVWQSQRLQMGQGRQIGGGSIGNEHLTGALIPDIFGQFPGVHTGDTDDAVFLHNLPQCHGGTEIRRFVIVFPHNHGACRGAKRFIIRFAHSVVANQRIGHDNGLTGIGGIRQNFLIAHHGGIKDNFSSTLTGCPKAIAIEFGAVL